LPGSKEAPAELPTAPVELPTATPEHQSPEPARVKAVPRAVAYDPFFAGLAEWQLNEPETIFTAQQKGDLQGYVD
jgi:hypothetical protein